MLTNKILFLTGNLPPYTDATSEIMFKVAQRISDNHNVEFIAIGLKTGRTPVNNGITQYEISSIYKISKQNNNIPMLAKIIRVAFSPSRIKFYFNRRFMRYPLERDYKTALKKVLCDHKDIDCIICAAGRFDTIMAVSKLNLNIPFVEYKLDPWGTSYSLKGDKRFWKDEQDADAKSAAILVTKIVYEEYKNGINNAPLNKVYGLEFPNIKQLPSSEGKLRFDPEKIHCVYAGGFYKDIRSPLFLLRVFNFLEKYGIVLHIVGDATIIENEFKEFLSSNIVLHGRQPKDDTAAYMGAADILVNLGNLNTNQLPSKIIECFSYGKPIINIYKSKQCPTLLYTKNYANALNILECEDSLLNLDEIVSFCFEKRGERYDFEEIKTLFPECTLDYVSEKILEIIRGIIGNRK